MGENFSKERIIKNTGLLYLRMAFTMWLNLYATRLVLANLGIDDMGVYGVVGSIVGLFSMFSNGITTAIQRFITFELGKPDGKVNTVFCTSINIIFILSGLLLLLLETLGIWYLNTKANIPSQSVHAAFWVYQISVLSCIINLISVPYNALIIAHEKMNVFAFISIIQVVLSCAAAYCLSYFNNHRLIIYAALLAIIGILVRIIYQIYCQRKFKEAQFHWMIDKVCMKDMGKFAGYSTLSSILQVIFSQGIILIINVTLGVAINAVYAIAVQLKNSFLSFSLNIFKAISPQITKTYANKEYDICKKLIYISSKAEAYLIYFIMIPFIFHTEFILRLWLDDVPNHLVIFSQCVIWISFIYATFEPIHTIVLATNRVKNYSINPNLFILITLPIIYYLNIKHENPIIMISAILIMELLAYLFKLLIAFKVTFIDIKSYLKEVIKPCIAILFISLFSCNILSSFIPQTTTGLCTTLLINSCILIFSIYIIGFNKSERAKIADTLFQRN